jgi:hypothetical protein
MDGKGRWRDNVFIERVWKSTKYEEVYLHVYTSVHEARTSIGRYLELLVSLAGRNKRPAHLPRNFFLHRGEVFQAKLLVGFQMVSFRPFIPCFDEDQTLVEWARLD